MINPASSLQLHMPYSEEVPLWKQTLGNLINQGNGLTTVWKLLLVLKRNFKLVFKFKNILVLEDTVLAILLTRLDAFQHNYILQKISVLILHHLLKI